MRDTQANPATVEEVAQKLVELRATNKARQQWIWCGMVVQAYRCIIVVMLAICVIRLVGALFGKWDSQTAVVVSDLGWSLIGGGLNLLIAGWAINYCNARADARL